MKHASLESILEQINQSAFKFLMPLTLEETYANIVNEAVKLVGAEFGSIILEKEGKLVRVYGSSSLAFQVKNRPRGNTYRAYKNRKTLVASMTKIGKYHPMLVEMGIKSTIFIPLSYQNKSFGVMTVNSKKETRLTDRELYVLELFGSLATLAIRKVNLYEQINSALKARDLFISMASHELRTPLTSISGYVQLLTNKFAQSTTAEGRWVRNLSEETQRLIELTNELLQTNNIKSGKLQFIWKVCSLREILRRAVDNFHFGYPDRVLFFEDNIGMVSDNIIGDFDKLIQVFDNLLDNAAKFSASDRPVRLEASYKAPHFYIEVQDQGRGIKKANLSTIFEEFSKEHQSTDKGMGLGLFIVRKIVMQHRGDISVKSTVNKGTTFTVELPEIREVKV